MTGKPTKARVVTTASVSASVGGWNTRDALANMKPEFAVTLSNFFPTGSQVQVRQGSLNWATGLPGQVESLMNYASGTASKLFAASLSSFYDVSAGGAVGAAVQTGLSNARWQHVNFTTPGGSFLYAANGVDKPRLYDGTTWTAIDGASTPAITGVTTTTLTNPHVAKSRIWFIQTGTTKAWYLPISSIGGAANSFDLGSIFKRGGSLISMASWAVSGGFGLQDMTVFITSEGEMAVYQGSDPAFQSTWSLVGVYFFGSPMGPKCFAKYGADLLVVTKNGLDSFNKGRFFADVSNDSTLTSKIAPTIANYTTTYAANYGWQIQISPLLNLLLLNVPAGAGQQIQLVMNTITGAWCQFTGWTANCWELFNDVAYFGSNGTVVKAWTGYNDNGANIVAEVIPAYSYFGSKTQIKMFTMARPILNISGPVGVTMGLNVDFDNKPAVGVPTFAPSTSGIWGTSTWNNAKWGSGSGSITKGWQFVSGLGYAGSLHMQISTNTAPASWISTDYVYQPGGVL